MKLCDLIKHLMSDAGILQPEDATQEHWLQLRRAWDTVMNRLYNHPIGQSVEIAYSLSPENGWQDEREIPAILLPATVILPLMRKELDENADLWTDVPFFTPDVEKAEIILQQKEAGE